MDLFNVRLTTEIHGSGS